MKKVFALMLTLAMAVSMAACSQKAEPVVETLTGEGDGYGGKITATVTVTDGKITDVKLVGDSETAAIGGAALPELERAIVAAGTIDGVDGVSGATWTSNGAFAAVKDALGLTEEKGEARVSEASATGLYEGLGIVSTPRLGPGADDKEIPVYSFNEVVAYVVLDEESKIVDLEVDIMEIITPNHDELEDNYIAGWPGMSYSADMDADGVAEGELEETEEIFTSTIAGWKTKREKGDAYKMNSGTWTAEMDIYEEFFKGMTADELKTFFAECCSDLNGRPLNGKSTKDEDITKAEKLTDAQKADIDALAGATMSLSDAHGDIIGAIVLACENAQPVTEAKDVASLGLGVVMTPRLGPGADDKEVPVYSFNLVATGSLYAEDGSIVAMTTDIVELITPNHDGEHDNVFLWPGQSYNNDADGDGIVEGTLEMTDELFVETVKGYNSKRMLGDAYKMNSGTWTAEMDAYEAVFVGMTADEVKTFFADCFSDLNGRPLNGKSTKDEDITKAEKMTDAQKADIDALACATMSLSDAHGDILGSILAAAQQAKPSVIKLG